MYLIITTHKTTHLDLACEQNQEWLLLNCNILTAKNSEQIKTNWAASVKERQDVCATLHGRICDILSIIKLTVCALFIFFISQVPSPENENNMVHKNLQIGMKDSTFDEKFITKTNLNYLKLR